MNFCASKSIDFLPALSETGSGEVYRRELKERR